MLVRSFAEKLKRRKLLTTSGFALVLTLSFLLLFQNCGKAGFDSSADGSTNTYNPSTAAPFAFSASVDMITYNSCNSQSSQGQTFTFKIGSYEKSSSSSTSLTANSSPKSGVKLTKEFLDYTKSKLKPDYPNNDLTTEQIQMFLKESPGNKGVQPQISLRSINKGNRLGNVYYKGSSPSIGIDILTQLGDLTDIRWAKSLIESSYGQSKINYVQFFPDAAGDARNIEAVLHFNSNEQTAEAYRNAFNKNGSCGGSACDAQIVVGFSYPDQGGLISPEATQTDLLTTAYGRGYQLTFQIPTSSAGSWPYQPNNQVARVDETDLLTGKVITDELWDCGAKFRIVRSEDAYFLWSNLDAVVNQAVTNDGNIDSANKETVKASVKLNLAQYYQYYNTDGNLNINVSGAVVNSAVTTAGLCPKMSYTKLSEVPNQNSIYGVGIYAGKTYGELLEIFRRHLPDNEWDINLEYGCVVPKKFSCYPDETRSMTEGGTFFNKYKVSYQTNLSCHHKFDSGYYKANKLDASNLPPTDYCTEYVTVCNKR
ncbi:MAG: hypothetical protein HUU56_05700 [Bdellovibrionaceae bacterium]|nr:hypothetical protein [Pseudobdellovibrionaceae bacterium]